MPLSTCYTLNNLTFLMAAISLISAIASLVLPLFSVVGHCIVVLSSSISLLLPLVRKCRPSASNLTAVALDETH